MTTTLLEDEYMEAEGLLAQATFPGLQACLNAHLGKLRNNIEKAKSPSSSSSSSSQQSTDGNGGGSSDSPPAGPPLVAAAPKPAAATLQGSAIGTYIPISEFAWDQGEYNSPTVSVFIDLPGVGTVKDKVDITYGKHSFDLKVIGLDGKNYRLINDNLEKDIIPSQCKVIVKANKLTIKLAKVNKRGSARRMA